MCVRVHPSGAEQQRRQRDCSVRITNTEAELIAAGMYNPADSDYVEINGMQVLRRIWQKSANSPAAALCACAFVCTHMCANKAALRAMPAREEEVGLLHRQLRLAASGDAAGT